MSGLLKESNPWAASIDADVDLENGATIDVRPEAFVDSNEPAITITQQPANGSVTPGGGGPGLLSVALSQEGPDEARYTLTDTRGAVSAPALLRLTGVLETDPGGGGTDPEPDGSAGTVSYPAPLRTVNVSNASQLSSALSDATTGDHIVLANGTYSGSFSIDKSATATNPIVIRAANPLGATLSGTLATSGSHVWLWGLDFDGYSGAGGTVRPVGTRHKIVGCRFANFGSSSSFTRNDCIGTAGRTDFLEIGYCLFENPRAFRSWSSGDGDWVQWRMGFRSRHEASGAPYDLRIHHCHFRGWIDKPSSDYRSAQADCIEIAPIGSVFDTRNRVDYCLFENIPDGSGSIIDIKAGKAGIVEYITTVNCGGRVDIRDADNWILRHFWMDGTQGIGVMGRDHLIEDIRFFGGGSKRIMLHIGNLEYTTSPGTGLRRQVSDTTVKGCPEANIRVGLDWPVSPTFLPRNSSILGPRGSYSAASGMSGIINDPSASVPASKAFQLAANDVGPTRLGAFS